MTRRRDRRLFDGRFPTAFEEGDPNTYHLGGTEHGWLSRRRDAWLVHPVVRRHYEAARAHMANVGHEPGEPIWHDALVAPNVPDPDRTEFWPRRLWLPYAPPNIREIPHYKKWGEWVLENADKVQFQRWLMKHGWAGIAPPTLIVNPREGAPRSVPWKGPGFGKSRLERQGLHLLVPGLLTPGDYGAAHATLAPYGEYLLQQGVLLEDGENVSAQFLVRPPGPNGKKLINYNGFTAEVQEGHGNVGNYSPPIGDDDWGPMFFLLMRQIADDGFMGPCGFDLRIRPAGRSDSDTEGWFIEFNARQTGASISAIISRRWGHGGRFHFRYVDASQHNSLESVIRRLEDANLVYSHKHRAGVIVLVWGTFPKIGILALGDNPSMRWSQAKDVITR